MPKIITAGLVLVVTATSVLVVCVVLALLGSPLVPSWPLSMAITFAGMVGMSLTMFGCLRDFRAAESRQRMTWRTDNVVPGDADITHRRALVLRPGPRVGVFLIATVFFLGLMLAFVTYPRAREWGALQRDGVETVGTIRGKRVYEGKETHYSINYDYPVAGRTIKGSDSVAKGRWLTLKIGDSLRVTYLPRIPEISLPVARNAMSLRDVFDLKLVALCFAIVVLMRSALVILRRSRARMERIWREGDATLATVKSVSGPHVKYAFEAGGDRVEGTFLYNSAAVPRPAAGDSFVMLFLRGRTIESLPWPILLANCDDAAPAAPSRSGVIDRDLLAQPPASAGRFTISWQFFAALAAIVLISLPQILKMRQALALRNLFDVVQREGIETRGTVTDAVGTNNSGGFGTRVAYRYVVGAEQISSVVTLDARRTSARFVAGEATPVTYASSSVRRSLPLAKSDLPVARRDSLFDIPLLGFFLALFALVAAMTIRRMWREWRIARQGRLVVARVEAVSGLVMRRCRYRFVSDHGDVEDSVLIQSRAFRPAPEERIEVLYATNPMCSIPVADLLFVRRLNRAV